MKRITLAVLALCAFSWISCETNPTNNTPVSVTADAETHIFHLSGCPKISSIREKVTFNSCAEAISGGYTGDASSCSASSCK